VEEDEEVKAKLGGAYVGYLAEDKDHITLQDNFRMEGMINFKVNVLGFRMVLLWSDKVGEVKGVVESVGWWSSLFEKVVPWSPELVSNHRVMWLRCYGVPVHAWGNNLFRALAFKFGRFVEVDEITRTMRRCHVARVKIVSGEKKLIDSSLTVSVKGLQFVIRVIEEVGMEEGTKFRCDEGVCNNREDENSSKGSYGGGGASVVAAVEGFSETGSDADVSDTYEVLLGVEKKRGGKGRQIDGSLGKEISVQEVESESISNVLGNPGELVKNRVNYEGDMRGKPMNIESAGGGRSLENEGVKSPSKITELVETDSGLVAGNGETEVEGLCVNSACDVGSVIGPPSIITERDVEKKGGCAEKEVEVQEPVWVRTRVGDLLINGPRELGPNLRQEEQTGVDDDLGQNSSDSIESFGCEPIQEGGVKIISARGQQRMDKGQRSGKKKKKNQIRNIPNLPFNMLRKMPGALPNKKKGETRRKAKVKMG
jgi:hypothetical protein